MGEVKEKILKQAIEMLQEANPNEIESVEIKSQTYDDGQKHFYVELFWPKDEEEQFLYRPEVSG